MTTPPLGPQDPDDLPPDPDFGGYGGRLGDQLRGTTGPFPALPRDGLSDRLSDGPPREGTAAREAREGRGETREAREAREARQAREQRERDRRAQDRRARDRRSGERRGGPADDSPLSRMLHGLSDAPDAPPPGPYGAGTVGTPAVQPVDHLYWPLTPSQTTLLVREALVEDEAFNDVTTLATVRSNRHARGFVVARQKGVLAGLALAVEAFRQVDPRITLRVDVPDGGPLDAGTPVLFLSGHARGILSGERVALNFLQRLSGVASLTQRYVQAVQGTGARILDTRKTTPGWRKLEKFAVRAGGGYNHRMDLASAVLIKDNHLAAVGGDVTVAVRSAREIAPAGARIEVECDTLRQVEAAVAAGADIVLLDNMDLETMRTAAELCRGRALTEASGGVRLDTVRAIAETGVDFISVGALTHSAPALDLALDFE